ncbi:MAG: four-carbon acid sugar kinase family protein [Christensenellales bacterium]
MIKLFIAADDFTGALDTGVQCAKQGIRTLVTMLTAKDFCLSGQDGGFFEVLVADTQSRHSDPAAAYERVFQWISAAKELGVFGFYKKTDSVMRGNVGAELAAALKASGRDTLYFIPAYPQMGRTVKNGKLYVNGTIITETPFARDPFTPVNNDDITDMICYDPALACIKADVASLEKHPLLHGDQQIVVIDGESDREMENISRLLHTEGYNAVFAGCAGFAHYLPYLFSFSQQSMPSRIKANSFLFVNGSLNNVSQSQIAYAESTGIPSVALAPSQLLSNDFCNTQDCDAFLRHIADTLHTTGKLIIKTSRDEYDRQELLRLAQEMELPNDRLHLIIAANFGRILRGFLKQNLVDVLSVFGGDTLHGILSQLGCRSIEPLREVLPGIAESRYMLGNEYATVVSKSGGFGEKNVIEKIIAHFSRL